MTVLVAYATCHGSTRGVAERLRDRLARAGVDAELRAVGELGDPETYEAVVLGSAVHGGRWLPEAAEFADKHRSTLARRPVWLYSVSTVGDEESAFGRLVGRRLRAMRGEPPEVAELRRALAAREHRNFAGSIVASDWPWPGRLFFRVTGGRYGDHRNWPAIEAWGDRIAGEVAARRTAAGRGGEPTG